MKKAKRGEGKLLTMQQVIDALTTGGVSDIALAKAATGDFIWLVGIAEKPGTWGIVPVRKGTRAVKNLGGLVRNQWVENAKAAYLTINPPKVCEGRFVVIQGDAFTGFSYYGPFASEEAALEWATSSLGNAPAHIIEVDDQGGRKCV